MEYYRQVAILISIVVIFGIIYALDDDRNVYAVNATEFLMNAQGFFNTSISFSFNSQTMMPNITGQYSNEEFGIANVVFKDGWKGLISPTQKGLLAIFLTPGPLDDNIVRQEAGGVIPQFSLYVVNKANYKGPLDGPPPTVEQRMESASPEELKMYQQYIMSMSKQRGVPVEQIEEEFKDMTTIKCRDLEESSTSIINGKTFDITSKVCSTPKGTFLHKTYLYEDNDRIYLLSMHGIQLTMLFCSEANEQIEYEQCIKKLGKPSLQIYLPALDETAKSLEISDVKLLKGKPLSGSSQAVSSEEQVILSEDNEGQATDLKDLLSEDN